MALCAMEMLVLGWRQSRWLRPKVMLYTQTYWFVAGFKATDKQRYREWERERKRKRDIKIESVQARNSFADVCCVMEVWGENAVGLLCCSATSDHRGKLAASQGEKSDYWPAACKCRTEVYVSTCPAFTLPLIQCMCSSGMLLCYIMNRALYILEEFYVDGSTDFYFERCGLAFLL